jgi:hypothetical protein
MHPATESPGTLEGLSPSLKKLASINDHSELIGGEFEANV